MNRALVLVVGACALGVAEPIRAQFPNDEGRWESATWVDELNFASVNVVLGALTGGITSYLRGGSFSRGFTRGALGGGVAYMGKRVSASRFDGAGLLGRQIVAVGASMIRNSSLEVGLLDSLVVPIGPLRAYVAPYDLRHSALRLDLHEASWWAYALTEERLDLDWGRTLSSGTAVFVTNSTIRQGGRPVNGVTTGGMVVLSRRSSSDIEDVLTHERVHVAQIDFLKVAVGYPLEMWARESVGLGSLRLADHLRIGLAHVLVRYPLSGVWGDSRDLFEVEAEFLEAR